LGCLGSLEHGGGEQEDGHGAEGVLSQTSCSPTPTSRRLRRKDQGDALAIAMGTSHAPTSLAQAGRQHLAMGIIEDITAGCRTAPRDAWFSSVPQELQDIINSHGGKMPQTGACRSRRSNAESVTASAGNIDTDNRMAMTGEIRRILHAVPASSTRQVSQAAMEAMTKLCRARYEDSGRPARPRKSSRFSRRHGAPLRSATFDPSSAQPTPPSTARRNHGSTSVP